MSRQALIKAVREVLGISEDVEITEVTVETRQCMKFLNVEVEPKEVLKPSNSKGKRKYKKRGELAFPVKGEIVIDNDSDINDIKKFLNKNRNILTENQRDALSAMGKQKAKTLSITQKEQLIDIYGEVKRGHGKEG